MAVRKNAARKGRTPPSRTIAFQGQPGAYSHLACRQYFPGMAALPTAAFEDTFDAVTSGRAKLAMIPIENSVAGRVADIHRIMPDSGLHIVGEKFLRVPGKGAVAVIAASWRVAATEHTSQRLIEEIFGSQTIGEALLEAKRSSGHRDFIHIFNLLGDPALPVSEAGERSDRSREQIRAPRPADSR